MRILRSLALVLGIAVLAVPGAALQFPTVIHHDFHGWPSIVLGNSVAEVVIVPGIGRVMQFRLLADKGSGAFWNHPAIGRDLQPDDGWKNYGGDKTWPSPQADWPKIIGRAWPPPTPFDSLAYAATIRGHTVELVSPVDSNYGIRVKREITLDAKKPAMTIETIYEKVQGPPARVAIWTITQLISPERAFIYAPPHSAFANGYLNLMHTPISDLRTEGRLVSVTRDTEKNSMIGSDGDALLWIGAGPDVLIENETPRDPKGSEWAEQGAHSKIYTNAASQRAYIELELLDHLQEMKPGTRQSLTVSYTLIPRSKSDPVEEAKKVFGDRQLRRKDDSTPTSR